METRPSFEGAFVHRCVIDFELRPGASTMAISLPNLAEMVTKELQLDLHATEAETMLFRAMDTYWDGSVLVDTKIGRWRIKYANQVFSSMTGPLSRLTGRTRGFVRLSSRRCLHISCSRCDTEQSQIRVSPMISVKGMSFLLGNCP